MDLEYYLKRLWQDYSALNPEAPQIYDLLVQAGETVDNDHIALRTFRHPQLGVMSAVRQFEKWGYELAKQDYVFKEKKLYARHLEHPNPRFPKIFISELETEKMSPFVSETLAQLASQIPAGASERPEFFVSGRPWPMTYATYLNLAKESEYASWVAAFGFRPNHFTVSVNGLKRFRDLATLNSFLKGKGFSLNQSGGEIKGSTADYLEQSSTMAPEVPVQFSEGIFSIPGCYYEFAKRYPLPNGKLFSAFVAQSADKIFESTNKRKS